MVVYHRNGSWHQLDAIKPLLPHFFAHFIVSLNRQTSIEPTSKPTSRFYLLTKWATNLHWRTSGKVESVCLPRVIAKEVERREMPITISAISELPNSGTKFQIFKTIHGSSYLAIRNSGREKIAFSVIEHCES